MLTQLAARKLLCSVLAGYVSVLCTAERRQMFLPLSVLQADQDC